MDACLRSRTQPRRRVRELGRGREVMTRARAAAADFTGGEPDGIAFGANMTTLNFLLAHAVARTLEPGDEIVVTQLDHDANVSPWLLVADDHDLVVRHAPIRPGGRDARPRRARGADRRAHAGGRLHARVERGRVDHRPARDRRRGPRGRRAGLGRRRAPRSAPPPAGARVGARRAALLALQVLRPAPGRGGDPPRPGRVAAGRPRAGGGQTPPGHRFETGTQSTRRSPARWPRSTTCARSATARWTSPSSDPGARGGARASGSSRRSRRRRAVRDPRR